MIDLERPPITEERLEWANWFKKIWNMIGPDTGLQVPVKTDATRGSAGEAGRVIFNSDDGVLNLDDGTNWILTDGTPT